MDEKLNKILNKIWDKLEALGMSEVMIYQSWQFIIEELEKENLLQTKKKKLNNITVGSLIQNEIQKLQNNQ